MRTTLILVACASPGLPAAAQCDPPAIRATDDSRNDFFGFHMDADGGRAVVGAISDDPLGPGSGSAYVFRRVGSQWLEEAKLVPDTVGPIFNFGRAVAVDGGRIAVSADGGPGRVFVFQHVAGTWTQTHELVSGSSTFERFGHSVDLDGDVLAVGAEGARNGPGGNTGPATGAVYAFRHGGSSWNLEAALYHDDPGAGDRMGWSVCVERDRIIGSAPFANAGSVFAAGVVSVFDFDGAMWNRTVDLFPGDPEVFGEMGRGQVALLADTIAAGTEFADADNAGAVYIFEHGGGSWTQTAKLTASDGRASDRLGHSVALGPHGLLAGAPYRDAFGSDSGTLYYFERSGGTWTEAVEARSDLLPLDFFGYSVTWAGDQALASATSHRTGSPGHARAVDASALGSAPVASMYCFCAGAGFCDRTTEPVGGCNNSLRIDPGGVLRACGSASVSADDLVLAASQLPRNRIAVMIMGSRQTTHLFGEGLLCVGPGSTGTFSFPPRDTGMSGTISEGPGLAAFSAANFGLEGTITAGQTWNFQCCYRDPRGPECGAGLRPVPAGFNLTSAAEVTFAP